MAYERMTKYIEGYYKTEIDLIEDSVWVENRDNIEDIVTYLANNFKINCENDYDLIVEDFDGLREIEDLWDKYCSKRYGRGDHTETIFLVVYELANMMKDFAVGVAKEKIDNLSIVVDSQMFIPPDTMNSLGDFAYPL